MRKKTDLFLLLPSLTGFLVFYIIPFFSSFVYAFTENAFSDKFVGLENFRELFKNEYFLLAVKNTGKFTLLAVPMIMLLSIILAFLLLRFAAGLPFVKSAFFLPVILPSAVIVMLWQAYNTAIPPFSSLLCIFLWKYSGLNVMLLLTALAGMDKQILDAARMDGAGFVRQIRHIILPNIAPTLFFTFILSVVNSLKISRESFLLYGNYPDESVYMMQNFLSNHFAKMNYQNISTAAIFFAAVVYTVVGILFAVEKKWSDSVW